EFSFVVMQRAPARHGSLGEWKSQIRFQLRRQRSRLPHPWEVRWPTAGYDALRSAASTWLNVGEHRYRVDHPAGVTSLTRCAPSRERSWPGPQPHPAIYRCHPPSVPASAGAGILGGPGALTLETITCNDRVAHPAGSDESQAHRQLPFVMVTVPPTSTARTGSGCPGTSASGVCRTTRSACMPG